MKHIIKNHSKLNDGFTLLEMLVAFFIFILVVISAFIIFGDTIGTKTKTKTFQNIQDNTTEPLELISREVRNAKKIETGDINCTAGLVVTTKENNKLCFFKKEISGQGYTIGYKKKRAVDTFWTNGSNNLTSINDVNVLNLDFQIFKTAPATTQPFVTIYYRLKTKANERKNIEEIEYSIKTSVTPRDLLAI